MENLHLCWQNEIQFLAVRESGDFPIRGVSRLRETTALECRGIYIIYCWSQCGKHFFYVGQTYGQRFGKRLYDHIYIDRWLEKIEKEFGEEVLCYTYAKVGVLRDKLSQQRISEIEKLLIFCHQPYFNRRDKDRLGCSRDFVLHNSGNAFPVHAQYRTGQVRVTDSY